MVHFLTVDVAYEVNATQKAICALTLPSKLKDHIKTQSREDIETLEESIFEAEDLAAAQESRLKTTVSEVLAAAKNCHPSEDEFEHRRLTKERLSISFVTLYQVDYRYEDKAYTLWLVGPKAQVWLERSPLSEIQEGYIASSQTHLDNGDLIPALEDAEKALAMLPDDTAAQTLVKVVKKKLAISYWGGSAVGALAACGLASVITIPPMDRIFGAGPLLLCLFVGLVAGVSVAIVTYKMFSRTLNSSVMRFAISSIASLLLTLILIPLAMWQFAPSPKSPPTVYRPPLRMQPIPVAPMQPYGSVLAPADVSSPTQYGTVPAEPALILSAATALSELEELVKEVNSVNSLDSNYTTTAENLEVASKQCRTLFDRAVTVDEYNMVIGSASRGIALAKQLLGPMNQNEQEPGQSGQADASPLVQAVPEPQKATFLQDYDKAVTAFGNGDYGESLRLGWRLIYPDDTMAKDLGKANSIRLLLRHGYYNWAVRDLKNENPQGAVKNLKDLLDADRNDDGARRLLEFANSYTGKPIDTAYRDTVATLSYRAFQEIP